MTLPESISEIGLMIEGHLQGQMSWSMSCKLAQALYKRLSSQQLLDLPNPSLACLVLVLMILYESILNWI